MPVVFVPGKGNVQFPDDMDMDAIRWTIENRIMPGVSGGSISAPDRPEGTLLNAVKGIAAEIGAFPERVQRLVSDTVPIPNALTEAFGIKTESPVEKARREALYGPIATRPAYEMQAAQAEAEARAAAPEFDSLLARGAYGAASSLAQMAPGLAASVLTRSPVPAYANIMAITAPEAYGRYRDRGGTKGEALAGAGLETGIEVATEMLPLGFVVNKLGKAGVGEFLRGFLGRELLGEEIATITQGAVDTAIANPDKTWGEYLQELPGQMAETAIATGLTAGALAGVGKGLQYLGRGETETPPPGEGGDLFPPPGAPATPPSEGLLGMLGQPGGKVFIDEGGTEVPYIFRGIDDTGRVMLEDDAGNQYLEDPKDLEGALTRNEPPVGAPPAPPAAPPAPPAGVPPVTPPAAPPIGVPPTATPPVTPPAATPPAATPPAAPPAGIPITPPTGVPAPPSPPAPPPPGAPSPVPGGPPPTPPVEEPTDKPFTPFQPHEQPTITDDETLKYWKGNLNRQRSGLLDERFNLVQRLNALEPEDTAGRQAVSDDIDTLDAKIGEIDADFDGLDQGVAPVPRARPLDDMTAKIADAADVPLENAVRNLPATGVMDWFAQNATTDFHRALAKRVGNMMRAMEGAGFQFNWGVYDQNFKPRDDGEKRNYDYVMKRPGTRGAAWTHSQARPGYSTNEGGFNKVDIGVKGTALSNSGSNEVTILHEFSHAVTVAAIQALRSKRLSPSSRVGKAIKDLQRLKVSAVKHKNKILKDIQDGKDVDPRLAEAVSKLERSNAWDDEKELIVQGLSNINMQIVLKSLPYKETNGFVEFIRQIGRLIGVSEKDMNGLRRLFELTDVLVPADATQQQEVVQAMTKPKTVSGAPTPATEAVPTAPQAQVEEQPSPTPQNTESRFSIDGINFDQINGVGSVPYNQNVNYRGFTAMMRPSKFLELAAELDEPKQRSLDHIRKTIEEGGALGSPFLEVDFETGKVKGHEGRHRMMVIQEMNGDAPIPVHIFGRGEQRARSLTPAKIDDFRDYLIGEDGAPSLDNFEDAFLRGEQIGPGAAMPSVPATELVVPEEAANAITSDAATAPEKDTKKMIAEAAKPMIKLYDMRSELQEKNRGCD